MHAGRSILTKATLSIWGAIDPVLVHQCLPINEPDKEAIKYILI